MKYSVLTYVFGEYELIHEITNKQVDVEYVLVTDNEEIKSSTWKVVYWKGKESDNAFDKVCYVRYHPFEFVNSDICVKIDGSIIVKNGDFSKIIDAFQDHEMCLMIHPVRSIIAYEYGVWVKFKNYPMRQADYVYSILMNMGHSETYKGLYQLCFSIQRKDEITESINNITYSLVKLVGGEHCERLDQTIFSFVLNKYFSYIKVMPVSEDLITNSKYMQWCIHGTNDPIPRKVKELMPPYLFDKPCEPVVFD